MDLANLLPGDRLDELLSIGAHKSLKANEFIIRNGDIPHKIAYVYSGLFRYFYVNQKGKPEIHIGGAKTLYVLSRIAPDFAFRKVNGLG